MATALTPIPALLTEFRGRLAAECAADVASSIVREGDTLVVPAAGPTGFAIQARVRGPHDFHVDFGGLRADFDNIDAAVAWIVRALSGSWRLRVDYVGDKPIEWELVAHAGSATQPGSLACGHAMLLPWFRNKRTVYLRNDR